MVCKEGTREELAVERKGDLGPSSPWQLANDWTIE